MGRSPGEPVLRLQRLTRMQDGGVLEYVDSHLDPLRFVPYADVGIKAHYADVRIMPM
jgi:DNA-binding GntR family transcriptional regulator